MLKYYYNILKQLKCFRKVARKIWRTSILYFTQRPHVSFAHCLNDFLCSSRIHCRIICCILLPCFSCCQVEVSFNWEDFFILFLTIMVFFFFFCQFFRIVGQVFCKVSFSVDSYKLIRPRLNILSLNTPWKWWCGLLFTLYLVAQVILTHFWWVLLWSFKVESKYWLHLHILRKIR